MDEEIKNKLLEQDNKLDAIYTSVEKMRKYFLISMWITVVVFVLPLIGLIFIIPMFLNTYLGMLDGIV